MKRLGLFLILASQLGATFWVSDYNIPDSVSTMPVTSMPWTLISLGIHGTVLTNSNCSLDTSGLVSPTVFTAAAHAAGKKAIVSIGLPAANVAACITSGNLSTFVGNIHTLTTADGYDGVDLDLESLEVPGDYEAWIDALDTIYHPGGVITMAVYGDSAQETVAGAKYAKLDQVNVECYDQDIGTAQSWYNGSLHAYPNDSTPTYLGCIYRLGLFTTAGVPKSKIGVGVPYYAREWGNTSYVLQPAPPSYQAVSYFGYYNVLGSVACLSTYQWDSQYVSNGCIPGAGLWWPFTGPEALQTITAYALANGYGGIMMFEEGYEYVSGGATVAAQHPLTQQIYNQINGVSGLISLQGSKYQGIFGPVPGVQGTECGGFGAGPVVTCTLGSAPKAGNTLLVDIIIESTSPTVTLVSVAHSTDTCTATANSPYVTTTPQAGVLAVYTCFGIATTGTSIVITASGAAGQSFVVFAREIAGVTAVDQHPSGVAGTGTVPTGANFTTTQATELLHTVGLLSVNTLNPQNGWFIPSNCPSPTLCSQNQNWDEQIFDQQSTRIGSYPISFDNSANWSLLTVTVK